MPERSLSLVFPPLLNWRVLVAALFAGPFKFHLEWNKLRCQAPVRLTVANKALQQAKVARASVSLLNIPNYPPYNVEFLANLLAF